MDANVIQKIRDALRRSPSNNVVLTSFEAEMLVSQYDLFTKFNLSYVLDTPTPVEEKINR
jgi:hypothetical protein